MAVNAEQQASVKSAKRVANSIDGIGCLPIVLGIVLFCALKDIEAVLERMAPPVVEVTAPVTGEGE